MAKKRNRYSRLMENLKATGGNITNGTESDFFLKFLTGVNKLEILNKPDEGDLKRYSLAVHPFAVESADNTANSRYKVQITAYSFAGIDVAGLSNNDLGIFFIEGGEEVNPDYSPALIKPSFLAGGYQGNANKISAVSGKQYNYVPTRTFSIPFGRTTSAKDAGDGSTTSNITASDELDVVRHLKTKIGASDNADKLKSISYEAEFFNEVSRAKDAAEAGDIPNATVTLAS